MTPADPDLALPAFLDRRGQAPSRPWRAPRWKKLPAPRRPEGERWVEAERWEAFVGPDVPALACGTRRLWVVEGRRWCYLRDAEASARVPIADWRKMQRHAKQIQ